MVFYSSKDFIFGFLVLPFGRNICDNILHFHGLEISSFNSGVTAFKNIQQNKPLTLESTSYHIVNGNNVVMELLKATPPDLYPTPTRPRRGTPDGTFGTLCCV